MPNETQTTNKPSPTQPAGGRSRRARTSSPSKRKPFAEMTYAEILEESKRRREQRAKSFLSRLFSTSTL